MNEQNMGEEGMLPDNRKRCQQEIIAWNLAKSSGALAKNPRKALEYLPNVVISYIRRGMQDSAIRALDDAILYGKWKIPDEEIQGYATRKADLLLQFGKLEEALKATEEARKFGETPEIYVTRAYVFGEMASRATPKVEDLLEDGSIDYIHKQTPMVGERNVPLRAAINAINHAVELSGENATAEQYALKGKYHEQLGELVDAGKSCLKAKKIRSRLGLYVPKPFSDTRIRKDNSSQ